MEAMQEASVEPTEKKDLRQVYYNLATYGRVTEDSGDMVGLDLTQKRVNEPGDFPLVLLWAFHN